VLSEGKGKKKHRSHLAKDPEGRKPKNREPNPYDFQKKSKLGRKPKCGGTVEQKKQLWREREKLVAVSQRGKGPTESMSRRTRHCVKGGGLRGEKSKRGDASGGPAGSPEKGRGVPKGEEAEGRWRRSTTKQKQQKEEGVGTPYREGKKDMKKVTRGKGRRSKPEPGSALLDFKKRGGMSNCG